MVADHYLKEKGKHSDVTIRFEKVGQVERMEILTNPFISLQSYLFGVLTGLLMLIGYIFMAT